MDGRRTIRFLTLFVLCVGVVLVGWTQTQQSKTATEKQSTVLAHPHLFQYAVKFVCLTSVQGTSVGPLSLMTGTYGTLVNVHNPSERVVFLRKKIALPGPGEDAGEKSKWIEHKLVEDGVFSVGCAQIYRDFGIGIPVHGLEGFLVIESNSSLDVTAVYSAGHADVESIAVEQIRERVIR